MRGCDCSRCRLENTLNYGMERIWAIGVLKGSNSVAFGFDEGLVVVKIGELWWRCCATLRCGRYSWLRTFKCAALSKNSGRHVSQGCSSSGFGGWCATWQCEHV